MSHNKKYLGAGLFAAIAASLCCIGPLLALLAGIGGAASMFSWIEPLRPFLAGVTVIALGLAWYGQLKPKEEIECDCEEGEQKSFLQSKSFLTLITVLALGLLTYPYYSGVFIQGNEISISQTSELSTVEVKIMGMTCEGCEANIQNYSIHAGAEFAKADYTTGDAVIKYNENKTNLDSIKNSIESLGYKVEEK